MKLAHRRLAAGAERTEAAERVCSAREESKVWQREDVEPRRREELVPEAGDSQTGAWAR